MLSAEDPDDIRVIDFGLALQLPLDDNGRPVPTKILDSAGTQARRRNLSALSLPSSLRLSLPPPLSP